MAKSYQRQIVPGASVTIMADSVFLLLTQVRMRREARSTVYGSLKIQSSPTFSLIQGSRVSTGD